MKLYQISELYCDYDNNYLIVSDKTEEEIRNKILINDKDGWLAYVCVKEIDKVNGYKIVLEKE